MAEGVRLYSQETLRVVTENRGVELVGQYISQVVSEGIVCSLVAHTQIHHYLYD